MISHPTDKEYLEFVLRKDAGIIGNNTILPRNCLSHSVICDMGLSAEYDKVERLLK
jgi:hypothetical protein